MFSGSAAVVLILFTDSVGGFLGVNNAAFLNLIGVGLGLFSIDLAHQASRRRMRTWRALYASILDASWVAGTVLLLGWFPGAVNDQGNPLLVGIALIVALFGLLQLWGAGEAHRLKHTRLYRHCVAVQVPAKPSELWDAISHMARISEYSPSLRRSFIRDDQESGVGAVRQCEGQSGQQWAERCIAFEPGKRLEVEFLCQEEKFPFPAHEMKGGWDILPTPEDSTEVRIWWELKPKPAFMAPLILPLLGLKADIDFPPLVFRMAHRADDPRMPNSIFKRIALPSASC